MLLIVGVKCLLGSLQRRIDFTEGDTTHLRTQCNIEARLAIMGIRIHADNHIWTSVTGSFI